MISKNKNEDAVSPVIGVMLMLVVTVVIAAVVVTFSTGLAGNTGTTPTALFEVSDAQVGEGDILGYVNIRHKGGDVISLEEIQVTLESIGGSNSGITQIFLATNSKESIDMFDLSSYLPPWMTQSEAEQKRAELYSSSGEIGRIQENIQRAEQDLASATPGTEDYEWALEDIEWYESQFQSKIN